MQHRSPLTDVLTLAALERPTWAARSAAIPAWHPRNEDDDEPRVPQSRFQQVNEQRTEAIRERDELRAQLREREREGLGEVERLRAELEERTRERDEARQAAETAETGRVNLERSTWVREAAARLTLGEGDEQRTAAFHDVEDALARIDLSALRTPDAARRAVQDLASRSQHLVRFEEQPAPSGGRTVTEVLRNGEPVTRDGNPQRDDGPQPLDAETFNNLTTDQLVQLQESQPEVYAASLSAAAAAE